MSEAQAEWAVQTLYENPGCRDELTDSEAAILPGMGRGADCAVGRAGACRRTHLRRYMTA